MHGTINALGLFLLIGLTGLLLKRHGRLPPHPWQATFAAGFVSLFFMAFMYFFFLSTAHGREGSFTPWWNDAPALLVGSAMPVHQIVVGTCCLFFLMLFCIPMERGRTQLLALMLVSLVTMGLGWHFRYCTQLLNADKQVRYAPNPAILRLVTRGRLASVRWAAPLLIEEMPQYWQRRYPAGWLAESEFLQQTSFTTTYMFPIHPFSPRTDGGIIRERVLWHTWLTGLYGVEYAPTDLWYPGGVLKDAIGKLEYRIRQSY